jgi:adenosylmethionine-8-amino-7-oxononanoate aminotransferase
MLMDIIRVDGPDCYRCPYGCNRDSCGAECFEAAEKAFERYGAGVCAFIAEPLLQAAAGMKIYPPEYLKKLRRACDRYDVTLIADEIATGFGRTGRLFACNHADIAPDIMCLSKGLTGGYLPMALAVTTRKIYDAFYADYNEDKAFLHSHTYSGNPLACSAANEMLSILQEEGIIEKARENAGYFRQLIRERLGDHPHTGEIRSIGLINAIELVEDRPSKRPFDPLKRTGYRIYKRALAKGIVLRPLGDVLYFNPPLTISREEMELVAQLCADSVAEELG